MKQLVLIQMQNVVNTFYYEKQDICVPLFNVIWATTYDKTGRQQLHQISSMCRYKDDFSTASFKMTKRGQIMLSVVAGFVSVTLKLKSYHVSQLS